MMVAVKKSNRTKLGQLGHLFESQNSIIVVPLILITIFSFGYMQMESTKLQQTARTSQQNAAAKPTALPALHTISQPDLPILNNEAVPTPDQSDEQATPSNSKSAKDELPIGPSSRGASDALQGVKRDMANDKNSQLQATRQSVKLDQLHL